MDMTPARGRTIVAVRRRDAGPPSGVLATFLELLVALAPHGPSTSCENVPGACE